MLTDSQIEQAKSLALEYVQGNHDIKAIENRLTEHDLNPETREQQQKELNDRKQCKQEIEKIFEKEYSIDLQKLEDRTALGIMNHVRKQQQLESQTIISSPDKQQEPQKAPITQKQDISATQIEVERHGEPKPQLAEPTKENTIFKVTGSPKTVERGTLEAYIKHREAQKSQEKSLEDIFRERAQKRRERLAQEQQPEKQQTRRKDRGRDRM